MIGMASYFFAVYALAIVLSRPIISKLFNRLGASIVVYVSSIHLFDGDDFVEPSK
jgi:hypothetical protein